MPGFVLGCHRSGTSLLAGILRRALQIESSQTLGPDLPASADNRLGFSESEAMIMLNEHLLDIAGTTWHQPFLARPAWEEAKTLDYLITLRTRLSGHSESRTWIDKDPRLCLTRDAVAHILLEDVPSVAIVRSPFEVAESLYLRNGFSYTKGLAIWLLYNYHIFNCTSKPPYHVMRMGDLLSSDHSVQHSVVNQLYDFLEFCICDGRPTLDDLFNALKITVQPSLQHCRTSLDHGLVDDCLFEAFADLWRLVDQGVGSQNLSALADLFRTSVFRLIPLLNPYCDSPVRGHLYYQELHALHDQLRGSGPNSRRKKGLTIFPEEGSELER